MTKSAVVVGFVVALLIVSSDSQPAHGTTSTDVCSVRFCGTESGVVVKGCLSVPAPEMETLGEGSGGALSEGECVDELSKVPCSEIDECVELAQRKQAPALGGSALTLTALVLGAGGAFGLRRRSRRS